MPRFHKRSYKPLILPNPSGIEFSAPKRRNALNITGNHASNSFDFYVPWRLRAREISSETMTRSISNASADDLWLVALIRLKRSFPFTSLKGTTAIGSLKRFDVTSQLTALFSHLVLRFAICCPHRIFQLLDNAYLGHTAASVICSPYLLILE